MIKTVCIFSSSSQTLEDIYYQTASEVGALLAQGGINIVYGGGAIGPMYLAAKTAQTFGSHITGVLPEKLHNIGVGDGRCDKLIITKCMRTRKEKMDELSDAVIALAGGLGTLEELSEMIVQKQLGYNDKAIVILNSNGFYDSLLNFFDEMIEKNFASSSASKLYFVAKTPIEAIEYLKNYVPENSRLEIELGMK